MEMNNSDKYDKRDLFGKLNIYIRIWMNDKLILFLFFFPSFMFAKKTTFVHGDDKTGECLPIVYEDGEWRVLKMTQKWNRIWFEGHFVNHKAMPKNTLYEKRLNNKFFKTNQFVSKNEEMNKTFIISKLSYS